MDLRGNLETIEDVVPGLWLWRIRHPYWKEGDDWDPVVTTTVVKTSDQVVLLDPMAPQEGESRVWERLDRFPPTLIVVLKPDHVRDVDLFASRYGAPVYGPALFEKDDTPVVEIRPLYPGMELPGEIMALNAGRFGIETPIWSPSTQALVFADALTERDGELRVWATPWDQDGPRRALRRLLRLPFEHVIISHGHRAVHDRRAYERAMTLPPWESEALKVWSQGIARYRQIFD